MGVRKVRGAGGLVLVGGVETGKNVGPPGGVSTTECCEGPPAAEWPSLSWLLISKTSATVPAPPLPRGRRPIGRPLSDPGSAPPSNYPPYQASADSHASGLRLRHAALIGHPGSGHLNLQTPIFMDVGMSDGLDKKRDPYPPSDEKTVVFLV